MTGSPETIDFSINTYSKLYPVRPTEIDFSTLENNSEPLELTDKDRRSLFNFERGLFKELKEITDIKCPVHTLYPEAFETEEGMRLFYLIYKNNSLNDVIKSAEDCKFNLSDSETKKKFYDLFFEDLLSISKDPELFDKFIKDNQKLSLTKLQEFVQKAGIENIELYIEPEKDKESDKFEKYKTDFRNHGVKEILETTDLSLIPEKLLDEVLRYSTKVAKSEFLRAYRESKGDISEITDPIRLAYEINPDNLLNKINRFKALKFKIKKLEKEHSGAGNLNEAKRTVLKLYRKYINVRLAVLYAEAPLLTPHSLENKDRNEYKYISNLGLLGFVTHKNPQHIPRSKERLDKFIYGTSFELGSKGLYRTIPQSLREYIESDLIRSNVSYGDAEKYNSIVFNSDQTRALIGALLRKYRISKKWSATPTKKTAASVLVESRAVAIPNKFEKGLIDTIKVVSHEVEGHVLRVVNKKSKHTRLKLIQELSTGRGGFLPEAGAMYAEDQTQREITDTKRHPMPFYTQILLEKEKGGSFRDCFNLFFREYAKFRYGNIDISEVFSDDKKFKVVSDYVYERTLRVFRRDTSLDDNSGYIPNSEILSYVEQDLVVHKLIKHNLTSLLFIAGIDLHSIQDLTRIGAVKLKSVRMPAMHLSKIIWPKMKDYIDLRRGEAVDADKMLKKLRIKLPEKKKV